MRDSLGHLSAGYFWAADKNRQLLVSRHAALVLLLLFGCVGCGDRHLRGTVTPSSDGHSYLAVLDDNGGRCGPLTIDGKVWLHPVGALGPIAPGRHVITCGGEISFSISPRSVFKFDYWGP